MTVHTGLGFVNNFSAARLLTNNQSKMHKALSPVKL